MADLIVILLLITGSSLSVIAAIGLVRLPDVFTRMHASTKAGTLGVGCVMAALAIASWDTQVTIKAFATVVFLIVTTPVAAHMLGRAAYRIGEPLAPNNIKDDWQDSLREVEQLPPTPIPPQE